MNKDLDEKLCSRYPDIFRNRKLSPAEYPMGRGFEHEDGWYDLLVQLCDELVEIEKATGIEIVANQIKQKFGTLRFYYDLKIDHIEEDLDPGIWSRIIRQIIMKTERRSEHVCESCGQYSPGVQDAKQIFSNLCDMCKNNLSLRGGLD